MQEPEIYAALFSDLSDAELGKIIADEFNRRQHIGVLFFVPAHDAYGRGVFMSLAPPDIIGSKNAAAQLIMFATLAGACRERPVGYDPDDDILSDRSGPWKQ